MTRRPRRPVLDPVAPILPTPGELADARSRAARYQALRPVALNTPVLGPPDAGRYAREAFPGNAWKRAAVRKRQRSAQDARRAATSVGILAFALRDLSLKYHRVAIGPARYTKPTRPAA